MFNELLWRKQSKGRKKSKYVNSLLPRLMTCITPIIVLFRLPSYLANIKFVCSHTVVLLLLFFVLHYWDSLRKHDGQEEEGRRGQPSQKWGGSAFLALRWLHSGRYKLTGISSGSHANEVRVGSSVAFFFFFCFSFPKLSENVGVHVKTALWGSSDMWGCLAPTQHIITRSIWQHYRANLYVTVPEQL